MDPRTGPVDTETSYSFLSSPDFLNADIADVRSSPLYRHGSPNSITPSLRKSLDTILDHLASEQVPDIFVAGDLVEGHWGVDTENTGTFGPVRTRAERQAGDRPGRPPVLPGVAARLQLPRHPHLPGPGRPRHR